MVAKKISINTQRLICYSLIGLFHRMLKEIETHGFLNSKSIDEDLNSVFGISRMYNLPEMEGIAGYLIDAMLSSDEISVLSSDKIILFLNEKISNLLIYLNGNDAFEFDIDPPLYSAIVRDLKD